jgi:invasion protein IalB
MTGRMRATLVVALLLAALPAAAQQRGQSPAPPAAQAAPAAPAAQAAPAAPASADDAWSIACDNAATPRNCQLSANVMLRAQNQRIARIILTRQPTTRSLGLVFKLPHGLLLPAGMTWQLDEGEAQRLPFQTSDPEGVYAGVPVTDDLLAALRRAGVLRIAFVAAAQRGPLTLPVPMAQFSDAVERFFAAEQAAPAIPAPPPPAPPPPPARR